MANEGVLTHKTKGVSFFPCLHLVALTASRPLPSSASASLFFFLLSSLHCPHSPHYLFLLPSLSHARITSTSLHTGQHRQRNNTRPVQPTLSPSSSLPHPPDLLVIAPCSSNRSSTKRTTPSSWPLTLAQPSRTVFSRVVAPGSLYLSKTISKLMFVGFVHSLEDVPMPMPRTTRRLSISLLGKEKAFCFSLLPAPAEPSSLWMVNGFIFGCCGSCATFSFVPDHLLTYASTIGPDRASSIQRRRL